MRIVMGVTPKRKEMERSLRLWGQTSPDEGESQSMLVEDERYFGKKLRADCARALFSSRWINLTLPTDANAVVVRLFAENTHTKIV